MQAFLRDHLLSMGPELRRHRDPRAADLVLRTHVRPAAGLAAATDRRSRPGLRMGLVESVDRLLPPPPRAKARKWRRRTNRRCRRRWHQRGGDGPPRADVDGTHACSRRHEVRAAISTSSLGTSSSAARSRQDDGVAEQRSEVPVGSRDGPGADGGHRWNEAL